MYKSGTLSTKFILAIIILILLVGGGALYKLSRPKTCSANQQLIAGHCLDADTCLNPDTGTMDCRMTDKTGTK
ncbi:MAG: hypothetical protein QFB87_00185 [Patescibacteria group bacterium]|nr:hypothetical protein [Patescibacteria group bacterium]